MNKNKKGFTLIELVAVVLIISILSAIALPGYRRSVERSRVAEAGTNLRAIYDSCERFAWENGQDTCGAAVLNSVENSSKSVFQRLDITIKGKYEEKTGLTTENFTYSLPNSELPADNVITATAVRAPYAGSYITFNGRRFECTAGEGEEAAQACTVWGVSNWNE